VNIPRAIAFAGASLSWKAILCGVVWAEHSHLTPAVCAWLTVVTVVIGFLEIGVLLGEQALEKFAGFATAAAQGLHIQHGGSSWRRSYDDVTPIPVTTHSSSPVPDDPDATS
jgi:hypothetical protein